MFTFLLTFSIHPLITLSSELVFAVFEALDFYRDVAGDEAFQKAFEPFPKLMANYTSTMALGRLTEWCTERRELFQPYDEYADAVMRSLGRKPCPSVTE
jgi:hypothetical protein